MIELYPYQQQIVTKVKELFSKDIKRVIVQAPTGSGKTVIFSYIAKNAAKKGKRILIISHRIELLFQAGGTLEQFGMTPQLITAKTKVPRDTNVSVAMVGTLKNRLKKDIWDEWFSKIDLLIVDECHRSEFNYLANVHCFKLGFSATPKRSGKMEQLGSEYDEIVYGPDIQQLINIKKLMPDRYFGIPVDLKGVGKDSSGEYNSSELFEKYNQTNLYLGLIDNWNRLAKGTQTIVFACNIQHCVETCKQLNSADIKAKFVTSKPSKPKVPETDNKASWTLYNRKLSEYENYMQNYDLYSGERQSVIQSWKNNNFNVLINAGIFVEGFDHKPTQTIVLNLATTSENKYLQMIGRGSRPSNGKTYFNILDFGANAERLGYYRQEREFSLWHEEYKGDGIPPAKECPKCSALVLASKMICPYCGFEFPKSKAEEIAELVEHKYLNIKPRDLPIKSITIPELEEYARQKGYKKAWVWRQIYMQHGEEDLKKYAKHKGYHHSWAKRVAERY